MTTRPMSSATSSRRGGRGHRFIAETDAKAEALRAEQGGTSVVDADVAAEVREMLAAENDRLAGEIKEQTEDLLNKVLYTTSLKMRNAFSRSDG